MSSYAKKIFCCLDLTAESTKSITFEGKYKTPLLAVTHNNKYIQTGYCIHVVIEVCDVQYSTKRNNISCGVTLHLLKTTLGTVAQTQLQIYKSSEGKTAYCRYSLIPSAMPPPQGEGEACG